MKLLHTAALALAALTLTACATAPETLRVGPATKLRTPQAEASTLNTTPFGSQRLTPVAADLIARRHFTFTPDSFDVWTSHKADAIAGNLWSGDCDDLSMTTIELLASTGTATDDLYRLLTDTNEDGRPDHMIAAVWADQKFWIIGDTGLSGAVGASTYRTRVLFYNRMSETVNNKPSWRKGAPWS